jgi:hypothetical protein
MNIAWSGDGTICAGAAVLLDYNYILKQRVTELSFLGM